MIWESTEIWVAGWGSNLTLAKGVVSGSICQVQRVLSANQTLPVTRRQWFFLFKPK